MQEKNNKYLEGKLARVSQVEMTQIVLPNDTNPLGNLLGGTLMHWIDIAAAMVASRHSNMTVATVSVDNIEFKHPIKMGELVVLKAKLIFTGTSSMVVCVKTYGENVRTGDIIEANRAYLTFVALDDNCKPTKVPRIILETDEEREAYKKAEEKRNKRLKK